MTPVGLQPRIGGLDLLAQREIGAQRGQQARGRDTGLGKALRPVEEAAAVDRAVHIGIKKDQQFLVKVLCGQTRVAWQLRGCGGAGQHNDSRADRHGERPSLDPAQALQGVALLQ